MPTKDGQRTRYKREQHPNNRPPLVLQERDRQILKTVYEYRFITSHQLKKLIAGSEDGITRRLQKLFHHNYVRRLKTSNNAPIVYALGNEGANELMLYFGIERTKVDWTSKNREVGGRHVAHTLMIGRLRAALELATRDLPDTSLVAWEPEGMVREEVYLDERPGERLRIPLVPDAYVTLRVGPTRQGAFFLEADRSTMTRERFLTKLTGYYHFWKQQRHRERFQIPGFRVLVVTVSEARKDNLRATATTIDGKGSALFWFACERRYTDTPAGVFAPIWQTAADDRWRRIVE